MAKKTNAETFKKNRTTESIRKAFNIDDSSIVKISLAENLAWLICKLDEIREDISNESIVVVFSQGKQEMLIQNPLIKTYNDFIKNYNSTIKTLLSVCGIEKNSDLSDEEKEFLNFAKNSKLKTRTGSKVGM